MDPTAVEKMQEQIESLTIQLQDALQRLAEKELSPENKKVERKRHGKDHMVQNDTKDPLIEDYWEDEQVTMNNQAPIPTQVNNNQWRKQMEKDMKLMFQTELRTLRGIEKTDLIDLENFGVPSGFVFPDDFQMPEFEKFDGKGDPARHIASYITKMSIWSRNEEFFLGLFHESLTGPAFQWYMDLEVSQRKNWTDLCHLFQEEYSFNIQVRTTRDDLKTLSKRPNELFKDYAQRWRIQAAQIVPKLTTVEISRYFIDTLPDEYVESMMGKSYASFAALVEAGTSIELIMKKRDFSRTADEIIGATRHSFQKREVSTVQKNPNSSYHNQTASHPQFSQQSTHSYPQVQNYRSNNQSSRDNRPFPNINITKEDLMETLVNNGMLAKIPLGNPPNPIPPWFKAEESCNFHSGTKGHNLDNCHVFRIAVLNLIDAGQIQVD